MPASAFDLGDSVGAVPTDVLNIGSARGSDELDLTSEFANMTASAAALHSTTNAAVFTWSGNPAAPGTTSRTSRSTPRPGPGSTA